MARASRRALGRGVGRRARVSFAFAVGLFFLAPVGLVSLIKSQLHSSTLFWLIEGIVRTAIFLGYLLVLSRLRELRRVFEYHGAEHKTIACYEAGAELTPAERRRLLAPAPALRHELPADRDDRRHLRLRSDRPAGVVLAARDARARRAADRRASPSRSSSSRRATATSRGCAPRWRPGWRSSA